MIWTLLHIILVLWLLAARVFYEMIKDELKDW